MKIVQIFPGKVWGGAEQYILDLGHALESAGHDVIYVCRAAAPVTSRLEKEQTSYHLYDRHLNDIISGSDIVHIHDVSFVHTVVRAAEQCEAGKPRVVLTRHIARASKTMFWRKKYFRKLHAMYFVSSVSSRLWLGANRWMDATRCSVICNSIPDRKVAPAGDNADIRKRFNIPHDQPLLMFTGRVRKSKGCGVIVEALSTLNQYPWHMVFVGAAKPKDYIERLKKQASEAGIADRLHFTGFVEDARSLAAQADIGLQPSIVREACLLSSLEFMQLGKPVVASNNGGQTEYILDNTTGLLVSPDDVDALAQAILKLITDPGLTAQMGVAGAEEFVNNLTYNKFLDKVLRVYGG